MLTYPEIDPVALSIGPLKVHWYGLMYLLGFLAFWWLGRIRARRPDTVASPDDIGDMLFYGMLGVVLGGRIGYILFYNFAHFLNEPLMFFRVWEGGMSFHGGLLGCIGAFWIYQRKKGWGFWRSMDFAAPLVAPGLFFGRVGNFINGELWGRITDSPLGMVFPGAGALPRHPSQLYEAALEGIVLFILLWVYSSKPRPVGSVSGLFLLLYGVFRFSVEFFRLPDEHIGYLAFGWLTMGHVLTLPMILAGVALMVWARRKPRQPQTA
ncbi:MAG: prolipoprotein diacylglyceryl transferase [Pseudomonadota bacterium]|nr:prolipoprotein diacylglyceryl transferase [Pseudomonadota bacterium]